MKPKFWFSYLALVLLLSGVAYFAISDDTDVPLALSDAEMSLLQGTGADQKCVSEAGCSNTPCDTENYYGRTSYSIPHKHCRNYNGWNCSWRGEPDAQQSCRVAIYKNYCHDYVRTDYDELPHCVSHSPSKRGR